MVQICNKGPMAIWGRVVEGGGAARGDSPRFVVDKVTDLVSALGLNYCV